MMEWSNWPVQLHRPDERPRTQRHAGALRNDALCPHPCRPGQAEARKLGRGDPSCSRRGEVPSEAVPVMMIDYMGPSLDTTIFGISSGVWLFANYPDQWDLVRNDPSLIPAAINEILRMEAPIQGFLALRGA